MLARQLLGALLVAMPLTTVDGQGVDSLLERTTCAYAHEANGTCPLYSPSLAQLLARPEVFHGKRVRVIGYLHLEFEGNAIYFHRDDHEAHISKNGFWVDFRPGALKPEVTYSDRYVLIEGEFRAGPGGHFGMWSGTIRDIDRVDPWPRRLPSPTPSTKRP